MVKSLVFCMPTDLYLTAHNWANGQDLSGLVFAVSENAQAYLTAVDNVLGSNMSEFGKIVCYSIKKYKLTIL